MADGKVVIDVILDDGSVVKGVANLDKKIGGLTGAGKRAAVGIKEIATSLGLVALASKAINMVKQSIDGAISRYDTLNNFPRVLQLMGFDAKESQAAIDKLSDGIDGLPTTLDSVAKNTQRIALMTGDLDGAVDTTLALNNAFLASGASTADAERGLEQYVQMLSKGEVDLQSWRTLQETMPIALNETAKAFGFTGKSAQNDLYDALKDGKITFDEFNGKIIELSNKTGGFADIAKESSGGIKTSWTNIKTAVVKGVADIIGAIDEAMGGTGSIESMLKRLKDGIKAFFNWIVAAVPVVAEWIGTIVDKIREWLPPMDEIKNGFINAFQTIRDFVTPIIQEIVDFIMSVWGGLVDWWKENGEMISQAVENAMNVIMAIMQVVWPFIQALIVDTWNAIKNTIQGAINVITGIIQFFAALFTGDWKGLWNAIKQILSGAVQLLWGLVNLWFVGKILKVGKTFANGFKQIFTNVWNAIKSLFSSSVNAVKGVVTSGFNIIKSVITGIMSAIRSFIKSILSAIKSLFSGNVGGFKTIVSDGFRAMVSSIKSLMTQALNSVKSIFTNMINFGKNAGGKFVSIGKDLIKGMIRGIKNMGKGAIDAITGVVNGVVNKAKSLLKIKSPSRVFANEVGKWIPAGIAVGIEKNEKSALNSMKGLTDSLTNDAQVEMGVTNRLRGVKAPLGSMLTSGIQLTQSIIQGQTGINQYDDGEVKALLRKLVEKEINVYMDKEKVGSIMDGEQARRINLFGRRVALD